MKNFEERLVRLESLCDSIRDGKLPLEEAVNQFEEGIKLARGLEKDLARIERRIEVLINQPEKLEEAPALELFPDLQESELQENGRR